MRPNLLMTLGGDRFMTASSGCPMFSTCRFGAVARLSERKPEGAGDSLRVGAATRIKAHPNDAPFETSRSS